MYENINPDKNRTSLIKKITKSQHFYKDDLNECGNYNGMYYCNRVQLRGGPQIGIGNGVQNSGCPGNIREIYIGCPHPQEPELGEGTHGAGPFTAILYGNNCAANPSMVI